MSGLCPYCCGCRWRLVRPKVGRPRVPPRRELGTPAASEGAAPGRRGVRLAAEPLIDV